MANVVEIPTILWSPFSFPLSLSARTDEINSNKEGIASYTVPRPLCSNVYREAITIIYALLIL